MEYLGQRGLYVMCIWFFGVVSHRNHISMNVWNTSRVDLAELYISALTLICFLGQLFSGKK